MTFSGKSSNDVLLALGETDKELARNLRDISVFFDLVGKDVSADLRVYLKYKAFA